MSTSPEISRRRRALSFLTPGRTPVVVADNVSVG